jgi:hypothetical protein
MASLEAPAVCEIEIRGRLAFRDERSDPSHDSTPGADVITYAETAAEVLRRVHHETHEQLTTPAPPRQAPIPADDR